MTEDTQCSMRHPQMHCNCRQYLCTACSGMCIQQAKPKSCLLLAYRTIEQQLLASCSRRLSDAPT